MAIRKAPWLDYAGKFSALKGGVFVALFLPALWTFANLWAGTLGSRPITEAIHQFGLWTIRYIFLALTVTPARRLLHWPRLLIVRRMIGVAACGYVFTHLGLYIVDEGLNVRVVAAEIVLRIYLTIGYTALTGLAILASTSTDGMTRWLGGREWQKLHRLIYLIGALAVVHFFMQSKADEWQPTVMAGLYVWLIGWRVLARLYPGSGPVPAWTALAATLGAAAATAAGEAGYFALFLHAPFWRVIAVNFGLDTGLRPAALVAAIGLALTLAAYLRKLSLSAWRPWPGRNRASGARRA